MSYASRACQHLESRRLLSANVPSEFVEADLPLADDATDVVVAVGREQIYPPLAPAGWTDESVGSFEEPAEITVAFFGRDPVDETPVDDDERGEQLAPPPVVENSSVASSSHQTRPSSIARQILGADADDAPTA
jgi:hypothetical protein